MASEQEYKCEGCGLIQFAFADEQCRECNRSLTLVIDPRMEKVAELVEAKFETRTYTSKEMAHIKRVVAERLPLKLIDNEIRAQRWWSSWI